VSKPSGNALEFAGPSGTSSVALLKDSSTGAAGGGGGGGFFNFLPDCAATLAAIRIVSSKGVNFVRIHEECYRNEATYGKSGPTAR